MPDRKLSPREMQKFLREHKSGDIFNALRAFNEEKSEPSLHDLCLIELDAKANGLSKIVIQQGRQIHSLITQLRELQARGR